MKRHFIPYFHAGMMIRGFQRAYGSLQYLRDFLVVKFFEIPHHKHKPLFSGKPADCNHEPLLHCIPVKKRV